MDSNPDYLQRAVNAERIASVIAHRNGHSFEKHKDEFGGDIQAFRQAIIDTLNDPETLVVKLNNDLYRFYNKADNVMVVIDRTAMDWGTAFKPDGSRGMMLMRERGAPILENGDVTYLNKLHHGYFVKQDRLYQHPEPLHLNSLTPEQTAEVLLSIFDRIDRAPSRFHNHFDAASLHVMPDLIARIQELPESEKENLRDCARKYNMAMTEGSSVLKEAGLGWLKVKNGLAGISAILRDPEKREDFIAGLEERFVLAATPEEEERAGKMLEACETFEVLEQLRTAALSQVGTMIAQMKQDYDRPVTPVSSYGQHRGTENSAYTSLMTS